MLPAFKILNPKSIEDAVHELARLGDQVGCMAAAQSY